MTRRRQVEPGQRYKTAVVEYGTVPIQWGVVSTFVPWDGGPMHARLKSVDDRDEVMTLAASVLLDRGRFVPLN